MPSNLFSLIDSLQCLVYDTHESKIHFEIADVGYATLNKLYNEIYARLDNYGELDPEVSTCYRPLLGQSPNLKSIS